MDATTRRNMELATAVGYAINKLGKRYAQFGHELVDISNSLFEAIGPLSDPHPESPGSTTPRVPAFKPVAPKAADFAKAVQQVTILKACSMADGASLTPEPAVPWAHVLNIGASVGLTKPAVAGYLDGKRPGLLTWVEKGRTVTVTDFGKQRFADLVAEYPQLADD